MIPALTPYVFGPALPEIILASGVLILVLVGALRGERSTEAVTGGALALLALAIVMVLMLPSGRTLALGGSFVVDAFARFMKVLTLIGAGAGIILSGDYFRRERIDRFEFPILVLLSTIGMMMVISANDLIALYLGLELL